MGISIETCAEIAKIDLNESLSAYDVLKKTKDIFHMYNTGSVCNISNQDINFIGIIESLDLTEREKDIMFISNFYHSCYTDYNISLIIMKEKLSDIAIERLIKMYDILTKYSLLSFFIGEYIDRDIFINEIKK